MKTHSYHPSGVCSRQIDITLTDDNRIEEVIFTGGCPGNLQGISRLVRGREAEEIIALLRGTICGQRGTSCPDQLSLALEQALSRKISA